MMNNMKYYLGGISASLLLVFSIFTLFSITEVNAEEGISVNPTGYENTIIVEFENNSDSKIKTVRMWPGGEITFESFKSEPGWGGGKYSDGKLIIFTATNTLNPGESVKFGLVTSEKIDGINWKVLDQNGNDVDSDKAIVLSVSETASDFVEDESKEVEQAKDDGEQLYGTKKFIPEKIRVGSDLRVAGNGFGNDVNLKLYLDNTILKSINTDEQGNFLTTISIPDDYSTGTSEFIIKDESGNIQSSNISIDEENNRFLKTTKFEVDSIPNEVIYDENLLISGTAYPQTAVILQFENTDNVIEKIRVVIANANGEWEFEESVSRTESIGEHYVVIKNNQDKTTKPLQISSDYLVEVSTPTTRYSSGETVNVIGAGEPSKDTTIWIRDKNGTILHYDVFTTDVTGDLNYNFTLDERFSTGTYSVVIKQDNGSDASFFGVSQYPSSHIITLMEKTNFTLNSQALLNIIGPPASKLSIKILDDNDSIKITDSVTTSSLGKSKYPIDLNGLASGIYKAVVSSLNNQDTAKFSVGLESASGSITLITTKDNYTPGQPILLLGSTGPDSRLTITLYDPDGKASSVTETFSDGSGNFASNNVGIPINAEFGEWKITAHNRLDNASYMINVSIPTEKGITLSLDNTDYNIGDIVMINGVAQSDSSRLLIEITDQDGTTITELETPITHDGAFSTPWTIPANIGVGAYTIIVSDTENSDSIEIFIQ